MVIIIWCLYILIGWIYQFPQTLLGWIVSLCLSDSSIHIGPAGFKYVLIRSDKFQCICLGEYLFIGNTGLTRYSYGRGILSRRLGPLFIPLVSIPSLLLLVFGGKNWFLSYWSTKLSIKYGLKVID